MLGALVLFLQRWSKISVLCKIIKIFFLLFILLMGKPLKKNIRTNIKSHEFSFYAVFFTFFNIGLCNRKIFRNFRKYMFLYFSHQRWSARCVYFTRMFQIIEKQIMNPDLLNSVISARSMFNFLSYVFFYILQNLLNFYFFVFK